MATIDRAGVVRAWLDARWSAARLKTPAQVVARQARLWRRMAPVVARIPAVASLAGRPLDAFPIVSPEIVRTEFDRWNALGLTRADAERAAASAEAGGEAEVAPGVVAGFSSGSSGRPGLFLSSTKERAAYLGHLLARLLPVSAFLKPTRIALVLRADNRLYGDVAGAGRFRFLFQGLDVPPEEKRARLTAFAPDVLIAPSHVLAELARLAPLGWSSRRLFYGAEPMGDDERAWIEGALRVRPDPIYQATEGFLGAPCRLGTLHLNEDVLIIEREPVPGTNRFLPIVTDLRRVTQPMIRVRLPDLLEPLEAPCACGSPLAAVRPVEGRLEDLWRWDGKVVAPREVEDAVAGALPPSVEWRATAAPEGVRVEVDQGHAAAARAAVEALLARRGVDRPVTIEDAQQQTAVKRRRVRWADG